MVEETEYYVPEPLDLPLLPLRDVVVFPQFVIPLFVGRKSSVKALNQIDPDHQPLVMLVAQKNAAVEEPGDDDIYQIGTVATIKQTVELADKTKKVVAEGLWRAKVHHVSSVDGYFMAHTEPLHCKELSPSMAKSMMKSLMTQFEQFVKSAQKISPEIVEKLSDIEKPGHLIDIIAAHLISQSVAERQAILEITDEQERLEQVMSVLVSDVEMFQVERKIRGRVKKQMEKSQREYYLNEQLKADRKSVV